MSANSALYVGRVVHRRLRPKSYLLRHSAFWMLLDLDEIDALHRRLWLFSKNKFNITSFWDTDHAGQTEEPIRLQIERQLQAANIHLNGGPIRLICMPRVFGYAFNPLSVYICAKSNGPIVAIIYEVRNTFGERHSYLIPADRTNDGLIRQTCRKRFYVSPFLDMDLRYTFRVTAPAANVAIAIATSDDRGPLMIAALAGKRSELTDAAILSVLARMPLVTLKVVTAIHWHALRMWVSGFAVKPRPAKPKRPLTVG
jgi:uncharacterized protein